MTILCPIVDVGGLCVELSDDGIVEESNKWKHTLVMYVIGAEHTLGYMEQFVAKAWSHLALPVLHQYDNTFFLARFDSAEACARVFNAGPFFIKSQPVVLKEWSPNFEFKQELLTKLPIWIQLPNLPLQLWGKKSVSKIASMAGIPMHTGECTVKQSKVGFARVLVEVDLSHPLVTTARIKTSSNIF